MVKKIIKFILELLFSIKKYEYDVLIIDEAPYSGSNSYAYYRYLKEKTNLNVKLLNKAKNIFEYLSLIKSSKYVCTSHDINVFLKRKDQIFIQFWHGIPLKAMGLLDNTEKRKNYILRVWKKYDYIISSSPLYNTLLNSTTGNYNGKYIITGFPRTDYFSKGRLNEIIEKKDKKVILFIPTFRKGYISRDVKEGVERNKNIFGMKEFDINEFQVFLEKNNLLFIAKLHPIEEKYYKKIYENMNLNNFVFLSQNALSSKDIDLYEILSDSDMLITDYSSIYFDYLLLNKPMIFINNDIEEYIKVRGLLLHPYDFWTPGDKVKTQQELQKSILYNLKQDEYLERRNILKDMFFVFKDNNSCERIYKKIFGK
ncbi:CDP-glycerol glycerophosphotransferase family protein [Marinitoga litoralis]|uniref:CDP-glycerol glycerophosphotransferase family protein n=1 Tax=Marinitoga litoralis TaxID=570855 RepID=UPI00195F7F03|nr:CDP-glycerol glycerophosphotransferase family protein [Marinitoga litoralis]MBM7560129.1 CDP-glycerol glycerophosphotransferase (TagB/SpsB family) [Marinitoga litoralis]